MTKADYLIYVTESEDDLKLYKSKEWNRVILRKNDVNNLIIAQAMHTVKNVKVVFNAFSKKKFTREVKKIHNCEDFEEIYYDIELK